MSNGRYIKPQGELRQSQVVMTYGPGSMVDLPKHSVLIAGLDSLQRGVEHLGSLRARTFCLAFGHKLHQVCKMFWVT